MSGDTVCTKGMVIIMSIPENDNVKRKKIYIKCKDCSSRENCGFAAGAEKVYRFTRGIVSELRCDVESVMERDPAAKTKTEVILLYSGVHAVAAYRVAHALQKRGHEFAARLISQTARHFTGIEIHPAATIGRGLFIDHGSGVVIGETAEIGDYCTLYQGVTLGGTGKHTGKRHPTLGNNVMVGAGAKVLGPFKIGDNSKIAAGAVVLHEVPSDSTAVGIPAHVVKRGSVRVEETDLDQVHIPDPVAQELAQLKERIAALEAALAAEKEGAASEKKTERGGLSDLGAKAEGENGGFSASDDGSIFCSGNLGADKDGDFRKKYGMDENS